MPENATQEHYAKVPLISNIAAGGVIGLLTLLTSSWDGHLPYFGNDLSEFKPFILLALPSFAMFLAHGIKSIGFKWSLGSFNRQLLSINKKKEKGLIKDIKKFEGMISNEKMNDLRKQLEQVIQDRHDIISNIYTLKIKERDITQGKFEAHQQTAANDNPELQQLMDTNRQE